MKKYLILGLSIVAILAMIVGLSRKDESKGTFKIGIVLPLTGNFASLGERMKNGIELAKEDLAKGSIPVDVIYEDGCLAKDYVSALTKLMTEDKIDILGGSFCIVGYVPAVSILEEKHMLGVSIAPAPDAVRNKKYALSTNSSIELKANVLGAFASETLHAKTAAVIYYNTQLGEDYKKYFVDSFEGKGGKVVALEMTSVDQTDFRSELAKVKALHPDVVFLVQLTKPLSNLLTEASQLGMESTFLGNSQEEDPIVVATAGKAAEGFVVSSDDPTPATSEVERFNQRYSIAYKEDANVFARNAYDAIMLEVDAYKACGKDMDCMIARLHSVKDYKGASGTITIQDDGTSYKGTTFKVVKDGKFVPFQ